MVFVEGLLIGLSMIIFIGPVFFTLLDVSLSKGVLIGLVLALGILISDVICIIICLFGTSSLLKDANNQLWIAILASLMLFGIGVYYLLKKPVLFQSGAEINKLNIVSSFVKGFLINFVNPFVFLVWISLIAYSQNNYDNYTDTLTFFAAILLGIFSTDLLKVLLANKFRKVISLRYMLIFHRFTGVILLLFGARMIWYVIKLITY